MEYDYSYDKWYADYASKGEIYDKRSLRKKMSGDKHVPAKAEGKLLRRIMSNTGLTEEQVREHKKYRKMLSSEQGKQGDKSYKDRVLKDLLKSVTKELKLPKAHPKVKAKFKELVDKAVMNGELGGVWQYSLSFKIKKMTS